MTGGLVNRGVETVTDDQARTLAKKHEVVVMQAGPISKKSKYKIVRPYKLKEAPAAAPVNIFEKVLFRLCLDNNSQEVANFTKACLPLLEKINPDIIIANNGANQVRLLQGQALKAKIVVFGHAGIGHHDEANLKASPDLFIALTKKAYDWACELVNTPTRVVYIPNPIDVKAYQSKKDVGIGLTHPIVMTVGALSEYKNIESVVEAVKYLGISLLLVGEGEREAEVAELLQDFPTEFRWIKSIPPSELMVYYQASDVFCFVPDPQEAFGRVYLEAMSAGLPIVASDDSIRKSIVGPMGIYVDPHNISEISSGIMRALAARKVDYTKDLESFKLETVIKQIEKEFHDLIK